MDIAELEVAKYLGETDILSRYIDKTYTGTEEDYQTELLKATTVYVGNLLRSTTEEQLHMAFSQCGKVKRVIMGLDAKRFVPCGFAFVEFSHSSAALLSRRLLSRYSLNGRNIYVDIDSGFSENRQFGRGAGGGQIRDEFRDDPRARKKRRFYE